MRAARHAEVGGQSMAGGPAQRRTGGPICQAGHAAPKLGRNIRLVTRNKVVGSLEPDGRLKFLSAVAYLFASPLRPILSEFAPVRRRGPQGLVPFEPGTAG
jgi:hypothetical protein